MFASFTTNNLQVFESIKCDVRVEEDELDDLCLSNVLPILAESSAVVDLEAARLGKYSSGLVL